MSLTDEERERLADVVELQPTKNAELGDRWGMDSGSDVHQYLENHLKQYYFRDDDSLIRATAEAAELTDVEPGIESDDDGTPERVRVTPLQRQVLDVLAGPDERSESVVSVLHSLRDEFDIDPDPDEVEDALQALRRKDVVEVVRRCVLTYRLAVERDSLTVTD